MRLLPAFLLLNLLTAPAAGQNGVAGGVDHDIDVFVQDAVDIFSAPADFTGQDWLYAGMTIAAGLAAWSVDEDVRRWSQTRRTPASDDWLRMGDYYGSGMTGGLIGVGMFGGGWAFDDEWTRVTGRMILQSQVYSTFVTHLLKSILGRARPFREEGKNRFLFFRLDNAYWAHPSGHATSAFALSSTLSRRVGSVPLSILLYSLASVTVVQRIMADRHWLSDTVIGAVIGTVIGLAVVQAEEARDAADAERVPVSAGAVPHRPAVSLSLPF